MEADMKKIYKKLGVILVIVMLFSSIPVYAVEDNNIQNPSEDVESVVPEEETIKEEDEAIVPEEKKENEILNKVEEEEPIDEKDELLEAEKEGLENSWRYQDGKLIQQRGRYTQYQTWPKVDGAFAYGVDVSHHNGVADWTKAKKAGVEYAIIRCGYGMNQKDQDDSQWLNNVNGCIKNNIPFGVYIYSYADTVAKAKSEAEHVLRLIKSVKGYDSEYPVYYDLEEKGIREKLSKQEIANVAETFCDTIEGSGYEAGVYANKDWFSNYLTDSRFNQWEKWVAQYNASCEYEGSYSMWQCSSEGRVDGFKGRVDLNIDFKDRNKRVKINEGTYTISSGVDNSKILSVQNGSTDVGASIVIGGNSNVQSKHRFEILSEGDGYYRIASESTGKVLEIPNNSSEKKVVIKQNKWTGSEGQLWSFIDAGNGYYYLRSKLGTYIDLQNGSMNDGNCIWTYTLNKSAAQKWKIEDSDYHPIKDGIYTLAAISAADKVVEVAEGITSNGANVQLNTLQNQLNQQFSVTYVGKGYYKIIAEHSMKSLDVVSGSKKDGVNLQQYTWNDKEVNAQLWKFVDAGNGAYYIKSKVGTAVELQNGVVNDKTNVQLGYMDYSKTQKWKINPLSEQVLRPVKDGTYVIKSSIQSNKVLTGNANNIQINLFENIDEQKFAVKYVADGYYKVIDTETGKALDVKGQSSANGTNLQEYKDNGTKAQLWRFIKNEDGSYFIKSKIGTVVDLRAGETKENTNVQLYTYNKNAAAQKWILDEELAKSSKQLVEDGTYVIKTALDESKVLEIAGGDFKNKGNIHLYAANGTASQRIEVTYIGDGYYRLSIEKTGKSLDVTSGSTKPRVNVQQYDWAKANAQLWKFVDAGNGYYYIKSKCGTVLDVTGAKTVNKTNIQTYSLNESLAQKWKLETEEIRPVKDGTYTIYSGLNSKRVLDVKGGSFTNGGNIQLYTSNKSKAQKFKVEYVGEGFYKIVSEKSGKVLDVANGKVANGTNIQQYTWNKSEAQLWKFIDAGNGYYYVRSKLGKAMDVKGAKTVNGTNIQLYSTNGSNAQKWKLKK